MCRFEHDLHNQGVVSTSLHVGPLVVTSHAQVEAHKAAGEGSGRQSPNTTPRSKHNGPVVGWTRTTGDIAISLRVSISYLKSW
jgi:hypothetical protein